ncbi:MAG: GntR family transcriptional regulator [Oscillospiraceae bacterium]|jgi:GntR family transcriptional regulator|nr:GntR family transcriptional regulator [Oscillospiraceae bacterium]
MFIDSMSRQPVYEQIVDQVEQMILSGLMRPGEQLPSVRSLSLELSINPNTIQKAYAELDGRGIIYTLPGRGGFVSQNAPELLAEARRSRLGTVRELARELALAGVPEDEVLACVRSAYVESRL